jgi:hypothetical protein
MILIITLIINLVNYYLMAAMNKRLLISESRGDSNQCTPCRGKPDQHDTYASHTSTRTPNVRFLWAVPKPFMSHRQGWTDTTTPEKKCSRLHLSARLSGSWDPPQFLSQDSHWSSRLKPNTCGRPATRLTGPITPACDRYIQYLLTDTNPSVLNTHRRGLPHRKPQNSHNTLPALHFRGFHWSP